MRRTTTAIGATLMLLIMSATAWAGGWATTMLDSTPGELEAESTYEIGYTILQHGRHPVSVDHTEIRLDGPWKGKGDVLVFPGVADGPEGHYVAEVTVPEEGTYQWEVIQGGFASHDLGTLVVGEARVAESSGPLGVLRIVLPLATLIAAAYLGLQLVAMRRPVVDAG